MRAFLRSLFLSIALLASSAAAVSAEVTQEINWADLVPEFEPIPDPFEHMSPPQIVQLGYIADVRRQIHLGFITSNHQTALYAQTLEGALNDAGIDVEAMLAAEQEFQAAMAAINGKLVNGFDGEKIRMPGFALPMKTVDEGVTELLLVPYVGACIHVPAPPPNQLVVVKLDKPFKMTELFTPIWVTGTMETHLTSQEMWLVDGYADIETGYALNGAIALPYVIE